MCCVSLHVMAVMQINMGVRNGKSLNPLSAILWHSVTQVAGCDITAATAGAGAGAGGVDVVDCSTQVDLSLAVATDPNMLVRQWAGLMPWI